MCGVCCCAGDGGGREQRKLPMRMSTIRDRSFGQSWSKGESRLSKQSKLLIRYNSLGPRSGYCTQTSRQRENDSRTSQQIA